MSRTGSSAFIRGCSLLGVLWAANSYGQADTVRRDSAKQATAGAPTVIRLPAELRNYRLTDSLKLGTSDNAPVKYTYRRDHDSITVFLSPLGPSVASALLKGEDSTAEAQKPVERLRDSFIDADRRGDLRGFRSLFQGADNVSINGHRVHGYAFAGAYSNRISAGVQYVYYGVYVLRDRTFRIRSDANVQMAVNADAPDFAKKLIAAVDAAP